MSKVEEGSLEVDEDDIVAEVVKAAETKVKRDEEEKRRVDEKKKAEEVDRQKVVGEESEKNHSPSIFARKYKHKHMMTPGPEPEPAPCSSPFSCPKEEPGCSPGTDGTNPSQCSTFSHPQALEGVPHPPQERFLRRFRRSERPERPLRYHSCLQRQQMIIEQQARSCTPTRRGGAQIAHHQGHQEDVGLLLGWFGRLSLLVEVNKSGPDSGVPEELRAILRKDDWPAKAYGTGRNARVFEQDSEPYHCDEEEDDFDNDGEGYTINHDDMTLDFTTDEWSMIGGGRVRRLSVGSPIEASPRVRIEKRRPRQPRRATTRMVYQGAQLIRIAVNRNEVRDSTVGGKLCNIVEKPSIVSTSPIQCCAAASRAGGVMHAAILTDPPAAY
ncbi:hypothetical protein BKA70DRAFT_1442608 [Coprinopsis sp. MPI-PUGE-AT-0042]|nr:hypothetical protein BKA70DRAFT_1442608 [Coprinopsis sp. MPI-PUGE-AT-0042]